MKLEPSARFVRDMRQVRIPDLRRGVERKIEALESAATIREVSGVRRVRSSSGRAYRIRIGDYRLGIEVEGSVVVLVRFLHRREFYRVFP